MKHRKYRVAGMVVAAGLLAGGILLYSRPSGPKAILQCSAVQPRPSGLKAWEEAMAPAQVPVELEQALFDKCKVSSDDESLLITHSCGNSSENVFAYELSKMSLGEPLDIGGGTLRLCAMGTAYLDATQTMDDDAAYSFYDTQLRSITNEQVKEFRNHTLTESGSSFRYDPFPAVRLGFEHQGVEDLMFHGIRVFDASTRTILSSGYSSSGGQKYHWFKTEIPLWHRTPVDVVLDVSYGPSKTFEFAPRAGEGFVMEGVFGCRLLSVLEGVDTSMSSSSSRDNTYTITFRKAPPEKAGLRFVFLCQPLADRMPVSFEFLDREGNELYGGGSSTSGNIHSVNLNQPLEKVALIRARYRTQRQRIVVHLPYIPGLPEENDAIEDLFDVRIPYVRFRDIGQCGTLLMKTLQVKDRRQIGPTPPGSINSDQFPLDFNDKTMREIAQFYAKNGTLKIDIESDQLNLRYPIPLNTRLKRFLQRIF